MSGLRPFSYTVPLIVLPSMQIISVSQPFISLQKTSTNADIRLAIASSYMFLNTQQRVGSDGNPLKRSPMDYNRFKLCLPKRSISALLMHLLSRPNMTSMRMSSSLCLKFPLPVLRYSGTEATNALKCFIMLSRGELKCFLFISLDENVESQQNNAYFCIVKTKVDDKVDITPHLKSAYFFI